MPNGLHQHGGGDARGRALHQLERETTADAEAHEEELADAEVIHHAELVIGEGAPGIVDRDRAGRFAADRVALVHRDDAEFVLEQVEGVEHRRWPVTDARVQAAPGRDQ